MICALAKPLPTSLPPAAAAGLRLAKPRPDIDGIDFRMWPDRAGSRGGARATPINVQVKSDSVATQTATHWNYRLEVPHFNVLADDDVTFPTYLFMVIVPHDWRHYATARQRRMATGRRPERTRHDLGLDGDRLEVIVPVSTRLRDYTQRINEVIHTLAQAESRPEPEIIRSVTDPYIDRQYFRTFPDAPSGMIPAADAAEAFQGVRELLIAAAYAEHSPRGPIRAAQQ